MNIIRLTALQTASALALMLSATPAFSQAALPAEPQAEQTGQEENASDVIIVTATRRDTLLKDTPISIRALGERELEARGAVSLNDYALSVPGLSFVEAGSGGSGLNIRGIGSDAGAATVGYYLDEAPLSTFGFTPDFANFDVKRVEILRGPQGTLYGDSSMGGTVRVITNKPNYDGFSGKAEASLATTRRGALSYSGSAVMNAPIGDRVAVRITGNYVLDGGFVDNILTNQRDVDQTQRYNVRAQLGAKITDDLTINLAYLYQNRKYNGDNSLDGSIENLQQSRFFTEPNKDRIHVASATLNYDFGFADLVSATTYYNSRRDSSYDAGLVFGNQGDFTLVNSTPDERISQEIRLASSGTSNLNWLIGGFYQKSKSASAFQKFSSVTDVFGLATTDYGSTTNNSTQRQLAGFGELSYKFFDRLTVTGGLRYYDYKLTADQTATPIAAAIFGFQPGLNVLAPSRADGFLKKLNLSYKVDDSMLLYAQYADGFRVGGSNTGVSPDKINFSPDSVKSYEGGLKGNWANGRVAINLTGYYINWSNIQTNIFDVNSGTNYTANSGQARSKGLEFELITKPVKSLQIDASFGWSDSALTKNNLLRAFTLDPLGNPVPVDPATAAMGSFTSVYNGLKGDAIPYTPNIQLALAATYFFSLGGFDGSFRADYQYVGDAVSILPTYVQLPGSAPASDPALGGQPAVKVFDYSNVNLRLGFKKGLFGLDIFANNLLDKQARLFVSNVAAFGERGTTNRPRTIGIKLSAGF
jgi:iron complex outermembrane recepter protein